MRKIPWHRLLPQHQRIIAYWVLAGLGIAAPWMFGEDIRFWTKTEHDCVLSSIYNGDTVRAVCGGQKTKIRFYCLDAPEMQQAPWGRESRDHLRALALSEAISMRSLLNDQRGESTRYRNHSTSHERR